MVEFLLPKQGVAGSNPVSRSMKILVVCCCLLSHMSVLNKISKLYLTVRVLFDRVLLELTIAETY